MRVRGGTRRASCCVSVCCAVEGQYRGAAAHPVRREARGVSVHWDVQCSQSGCVVCLMMLVCVRACVCVHAVSDRSVCVLRKSAVVAVASAAICVCVWCAYRALHRDTPWGRGGDVLLPAAPPSSFCLVECLAPQVQDVCLACQCVHVLCATLRKSSSCSLAGTAVFCLHARKATTAFGSAVM